MNTVKNFSAVKLNQCVRSFNASVNDLSNKICVLNKTKDLNLSVFNMITGIIEPKMLTKHISCEWKCKFDETKCKLNQLWDNNKWRCECKKHHICEKDCVWSPASCSCDNEKYLAGIMDDSAITCDEVKKSYDEDINFNEKKAICKTQNSYILLAFLLNTIALLIAVSIYYLYVIIMSRTSFRVNPHFIVCLNVKELFAGSRHHIGTNKPSGRGFESQCCPLVFAVIWQNTEQNIYHYFTT